MGVPTARRQRRGGRRVDGVQRAQKPDLGRGSHTGGSPQPMRMTLRLCCCRDGSSATALHANRRRDRVIIMVLVQCSVAKVCGCRCALRRARQRFRRKGSLRRLSCRNRFRSRSSDRAQPLCLCQVPESSKAKESPTRHAIKRTPRPRHGSARPRYDCDRAAGQETT